MLLLISFFFFRNIIRGVPRHHFLYNYYIQLHYHAGYYGLSLNLCLLILVIRFQWLQFWSLSCFTRRIPHLYPKDHCLKIRVNKNSALHRAGLLLNWWLFLIFGHSYHLYWELLRGFYHLSYLVRTVIYRVRGQDIFHNGY